MDVGNGGHTEHAAAQKKSVTRAAARPFSSNNAEVFHEPIWTDRHNSHDTLIPARHW